MADKLKPCPFCGGDDVYIGYSFLYINGNCYFEIRHKSENCPISNNFGEFVSGMKYTTKEAAIEAWNRRANDE